MDKFYSDLSHYAFRMHRDLTPCDALVRIEACLKKPVKKMDYRYSVVVAREEQATRPHIQCYLVFAMPPKTLLHRLKDEFQLSGNADYSFMKVKNRIEYLSYVLKEGNYVYTPELLEEIQNSPDWIPPDTSQKDFNQKYSNLANAYLSTEMSDYNFLLKLLELYSDFNKNIYIAHIRAQWLGLANQRNLPLNKTGYRVCGNSRPFRHLLIEEIMRGYALFEN